MGELRARTAIVHDWFQGYHGAERTVEAMRADLFAPGCEPDVFTFQAARELLPPDLANAIVAESTLSRLPGLRQRGHDPGRWRYLLPVMGRYFEGLDLENYDLVISSSHACAVDVRPRKDALHVCYCYTPMRYAWLPGTEGGRLTGAQGAALRLLRRRLQRRDLAASRRPDLYVAISQAVRERIRAFYGRDSVVVHPPVDVDDLDHGRDKEAGHFLWVNRLVSYKRPELVVEAFRGLPYRLTMVGIGPLEAKLRSMLPPNVELRGWTPRRELVALYERSSGFLHVGEEDFGIATVEALAAGTPVVALDRGGARDIVRDGEDGILVADDDVATLRGAIRDVAERTWEPGRLAERAQRFSRGQFVGRLRAELTPLLS